MKSAEVAQSPSLPCEPAGSSPVHPRRGLLPWQARCATKAMSADHGDSISIERIARSCGMSPRNFVRRFRETTGVTPHRWLMDQRLARARDLLLTGVALAETAQLCGFADQSHFTRTFSRSVGEPPGRWLRLRRETHRVRLPSSPHRSAGQGHAESDEQGR
jgi:AraC family transcriptional regulator